MDPNFVTFLIVDDMKVQRMAIVRQVKLLGFANIMEASNGLEGWTKVDGFVEADDHRLVVLSDWNMPECDGLEFLRKVRSDDRFKKLCFLIITAEMELSSVDVLAKEGVTAYLAKPFTAEQFKESVTKAMRIAGIV